MKISVLSALIVIVLANLTLAKSGWTRVERNVFIDYDLENFPLEIKTNSPMGSEDVLRVYLYDSQGTYAGAFGIKFDSTPQYYIRGCRGYTDFPKKIPTRSNTEKVWRISFIKSSGTIDEQVCDQSSAVKLVVHCNGVEVLDFLFSPSTCPDDGWITPYIRGHVAKIWFFSGDTASDYYMSQSRPCLCSNINSAAWTVSDIKYDITIGEVVPMRPTIVGRKIIRNEGSETVSMKLTVSETVTETMLLSQPIGLSISVGTTFSTGVPFIAAGEISSEVSVPYEFNYGRVKSVEKPLNVEFECNGPAGKVTTCTVVVIKEEASVPYTMTWTKNIDEDCTCEVKARTRLSLPIEWK